MTLITGGGDPNGCGGGCPGGRLGYTVQPVLIHKDMTSRDLLQQRKTLPNGDTVWESSSLITAATEGSLAVLDGVHLADSSTLSVLQRMAQVPAVHQHALRCGRRPGIAGHCLLQPSDFQSSHCNCNGGFQDREMSLHDGSILLPAWKYDEIARIHDLDEAGMETAKLRRVHPSFR